MMAIPQKKKLTVIQYIFLHNIVCIYRMESAFPPLFIFKELLLFPFISFFHNEHGNDDDGKLQRDDRKD